MIKVISTQKGDGYERGEYTITVDGQAVYSIYNMSDCPEDAIIARDLPTSSVMAAMHLMYELGREGKDVEWEEIWEEIEEKA